MKRFSFIATFLVAVLVLIGCPTDSDSNDGKPIPGPNDVGVLVMGSGGAGFSAAIAAKTANPNARVVIVEKTAATGGATRMSGQLVKMPRDDTPEEIERFKNYMIMRGRGQSDPALITKWAENARTVVGYYTDISTLTKSSSGTNPEQDMHTFPNIIPTLETKARNLGVEVWVNCRGMSLIVENGAVVGAMVKHTAASEETRINVKGGVILATGGYNRSSELLTEFNPTTVNDPPGSHVGHDGDGIIMARRDAGAALSMKGGRIGYMSGRHITSEGTFNNYYNGITVPAENTPGTNFAGYQYTSLAAVTYEVNGRSDYAVARRFADEERAAAVAAGRGATFKLWNVSKQNTQGTAGNTFNSIDELADYLLPDMRTGITKQNVVDALTTMYGGNDWTTAQQGYTWYRAAIVSSYSDLGTIGGIKVNADGQVIRASDSKPITGLYAVGETANGDVFYLEYPGSGSSNSSCLTLGWFTGTHAGNRSR